MSKVCGPIMMMMMIIIIIIIIIVIIITVIIKIIVLQFKMNIYRGIKSEYHFSFRAYSKIRCVKLLNITIL